FVAGLDHRLVALLLVQTGPLHGKLVIGVRHRQVSCATQVAAQGVVVGDVGIGIVARILGGSTRIGGESRRAGTVATVATVATVGRGRQVGIHVPATVP